MSMYIKSYENQQYNTAREGGVNEVAGTWYVAKCGV